MSDKPTNYDIILFGSDLQGAELQTAIGKLALMLKTTPEQAKHLLEIKGEVIAKGVATELAHQVKNRLSSMGIHAELRAAVTDTELQLAPIEKPQQVYRCPACGHPHQFTGVKPLMCENFNCRVVFDKYGKKKKEVEDRKKVEERILKDIEESKKRDEELQAEMERAKRLEAEIT